MGYLRDSNYFLVALAPLVKVVLHTGESDTSTESLDFVTNLLYDIYYRLRYWDKGVDFQSV